MANIADVAIPSTSTFNALTADYTPRVLVDNIFVGTPMYNYMRRHMKAVGGKSWQPIVEYDNLSGAWYARGGTQALSASGDIATRAAFTMKFYALPVYLYAQDTDLGAGESLVDFMGAYVKNALNSIKKDLNEAFFEGDPTATPAELDSLNLACDDTASWGGLDVATYSTWKAHVMEGESTFTTPVSPTLNNIGKMVRTITTTTGEKPDMIVVDEDLWDVLFAQYTASVTVMDQVSRKDPVARWGFEAIYVHGVPIVTDRDMINPGAWVSAGTRTLAKGSQVMFLNWNHLNLAYNAKRAFKWDPDGWRRPDTVDSYFNRIYFWGVIGGDSRRTLGRIYNIDVDQAEASWSLGTVDIPA